MGNLKKRTQMNMKLIFILALIAYASTNPLQARQAEQDDALARENWSWSGLASGIADVAGAAGNVANTLGVRQAELDDALARQNWSWSDLAGAIGTAAGAAENIAESFGARRNIWKCGNGPWQMTPCLGSGYRQNIWKCGNGPWQMTPCPG